MILSHQKIHKQVPIICSSGSSTPSSSSFWVNSFPLLQEFSYSHNSRGRITLPFLSIWSNQNSLGFIIIITEVPSSKKGQRVSVNSYILTTINYNSENSFMTIYTWCQLPQFSPPLDFSNTTVLYHLLKKWWVGGAGGACCCTVLPDWSILWPLSCISY